MSGKENRQKRAETVYKEHCDNYINRMDLVTAIIIFYRYNRVITRYSRIKEILILCQMVSFVSYQPLKAFHSPSKEVIWFRSLALVAAQTEDVQTSDRYFIATFYTE